MKISALLVPAQAVIVLAAVRGFLAPLGVSGAFAQHVGEAVLPAFVYERSTAANVVAVTEALRAAGIEEDSGLLTERAVRTLVDPIEAEIADKGLGNATSPYVIFA